MTNPSLRLTSPLVLALALAACATAGPGPLASSIGRGIPPGEASADIAPLGDLVAGVNIPYERFELANGLTVLVHTDRKAPIIGVTTHYTVGSKHEPRGRTGFAHLFEHLMFGGSENVPNFDIPLESAGSTPTNGSTWYDRTNYVQVVPTGALDRVLMMEADRMGFLLGAVTQDKLDKQRGVVQNEKRQGDNQPYGLADYIVSEELLPVGHPYRHSTIGSMADLSAADLSDVRKWFRDHYGPNNVVLALTGDIDAATARPLVEKWFGDIPRGPEVRAVEAPVVTLPAAKTRDITDAVPVTRITRTWTGPGITHPDATALQVGMYVLGGLASSRLDNALVRGDELAVRVSAGALVFEQISQLSAEFDLKPGEDRATAQARFDAIIANYIAQGPTQDELTRAATQIVSGQIGALERVGNFGGKGMTLAEGLVYQGDPASYKKDLEEIAALTPERVRKALATWLGRPALTLAVVPGERTLDGAKLGGWGDEATTPPPAPDARKPVPAIRSGAPRQIPPVADVGALPFPALERARLSNGVPVLLARRTAVPKVTVNLRFDAGFSVDAPDEAGVHSLMVEAMDDGTRTRDAARIAEDQERLGASISAGSGLDADDVTLTALTANLAPSLALMADIVQNPAFTEKDVARVKDQRLAEIGQQLASPQGIAGRALLPIVYGDQHPYGRVGSAGTAAAIGAVTRERLAAEHGRWLRPDTAAFTVVGDVTMAELLPRLEAAFGTWRANRMARPVKTLPTAGVPAQTRLVVIDRPNSPQSVIYAGRVLPVTGGTAGLEALDLANEVLGDGFLSRLNLLIREEKGWSYGVRSGVSAPKGQRLLTVAAPVQSDRTGESIALILSTMNDLATGKTGVNAEEFARVTDGSIRGLPNRFETNGQVLGALLALQARGLPDDYYTRLPETYRALTPQALDAAAKRYLGGSDLAIVVVGDRKAIDPQLARLGLPIEVREAN
ncbi:M16 family metallopeptidase [Qipengyuania sediminis]|uniref:M16 family metallopeptidase n=1 Tax=Qipengyuania sediminis TaxID=1532023 RepID=UPI001059795E|nr:pitrilysin family protein [Qipengyuania sediminis]